jgi:hypothetical protein
VNVADCADLLVFDLKFDPASVGGMSLSEIDYWLSRAVAWAKRRRKS